LASNVKQTCAVQRDQSAQYLEGILTVGSKDFQNGSLAIDKV
jgi:hypothetical protein